MNPDIAFFGTVFAAFFAIMNPLANTPVFLGLTEGMDVRTTRRLALNSLILTFVIVSVFALLGNAVLSFFGITLYAFKIAGGILVGLVGDRNTPDIASPLLSNGRIYYHKAKTGILTCHDAATGKVLFGPERIPEIANTYASPIAAGGHVYLTGRSGNTTVIKDSGTLEVVATNSVGETVDATPAPVDNELFIRGEKHLFCISEQLIAFTERSRIFDCSFFEKYEP